MAADSIASRIPPSPPHASFFAVPVLGYPAISCITKFPLGFATYLKDFGCLALRRCVAGLLRCCVVASLLLIDQNAITCAPARTRYSIIAIAILGSL